MGVPKIRRGGTVAADTTASTTVEPCVGCHDETAASSALYSDRLEIDRSDGGKAYLCADCHARARAAKTGGELSDADLRTIGDNGLMIGAGLFGI
jgi:hypothetical protein